MPPNYPKDQDDDPFLRLEEDEEGQSAEELESQVQKAKVELEDLRRKQEQIEKEKQRLEELSRKQEELEQGRSEMIDKLNRALVIIQREADETQKRVEQLHSIKENFRDHLNILDEMNPRMWGTAEMPKEIGKGLTALDSARADYSKAQAKIAVEAPESAAAAELAEYEEGDDGARDFGYWFRSGVAFTLPLQVIGLLALVLWAWSLLMSQ